MFSAVRVRSGAKVLAIAAASSVAFLGLAASPASADDSALIEITAPDRIDLERGAQTTVIVTLDVKPAKPGDTEAKDLWFDTSTAGAFTPLVSVVTPAGCETYPSGDGFSCRWASLPVGKKQISIDVKAAAPNDHYGDGTLRYSARQTYGPIANATTEVSLHAPVTLAATHPGRGLQAKPGSTIEIPMGTQNVKTETVDQVTLVISSEYGLPAAQQYSNCRYGTAGENRLTNVVACDFDTAIKPGESYALASPYKFSVAADIPMFGGQFSYTFLPRGVANKQLTGDLTTGSGPRLELAKSQVAAPDKWVASGSYSVEALDQTSQVKAQGATVDAAVGQEAEMRIVVRNEGAATLNTWGGSEGQHVNVVFLPKGVTVVQAPAKCVADDGYSAPSGIPVKKPAGGSNYACFLAKGDAWKAGTDREFVFRVKVTEPMVGTKGHNVALNWGEDKYSVADIVFDTSKPTTTGGTTGTTGGQQPSGDDGPELAETGGSSSAPLIAGVAGGLLVVAAGAFVVVRRRKAAGGVAA